MSYGVELLVLEWTPGLLNSTGWPGDIEQRQQMKLQKDTFVEVLPAERKCVVKATFSTDVFD